MPFRWTINPYRGCSHACAYCFARPTHKYLDFDAGRDFEREIVVKVNVPEVLRGRAAAAVVEGRAHRDGHEHRPVPVGRGPLPAHARASGRRCATRATRARSSPSRRCCCATWTCCRRSRRSRRSARTSRSRRSTRRPGGRPSRTRRTRGRGSRRWPSSTAAGHPDRGPVAPLMPGINDDPAGRSSEILQTAADAGAEHRRPGAAPARRGRGTCSWTGCASHRPGPGRALRGALRPRGVPAAGRASAARRGCCWRRRAPGAPGAAMPERSSPGRRCRGSPRRVGGARAAPPAGGGQEALF